MQRGGCLCGAITYEVTGALGQVTACHCTQCRKQTGHYAAAVPAPWGDVTLSGTPKWYNSTPGARRGFCGTCGSYLFWEEYDGLVYLMAGAFDAPTGLRMDGHIYYADKGDYYTAGEDLPCFAAGRSGLEAPS